MKLDPYFIDSVKMEANANRYTFVWDKAVVKQQVKLQEKVQTLFETIAEAERQDEREHTGPRPPGTWLIASEKLAEAVEKLESQTSREAEGQAA